MRTAIENYILNISTKIEKDSPLNRLKRVLTATLSSFLFGDCEGGQKE